MGIHPIILCGGPGSRLWPASTARDPKPFIDLLGPRSLFQQTVLRMAALPGAGGPIVVTGADHMDMASRQLAELGVKGTVIVEPAGRDSGPALLAAAIWIESVDRSGVAVAVASDHHIPDEAAFAAAVIEATPAAEQGRIVTFGVRPDGPATAYGYIRPGEPLDGSATVRRVGRFVEKPDAVRAQALVAEGCLWNSGNFMFRVDTFLQQATLHAPDAVARVRDAVRSGVGGAGVLRLGEAFHQAPKISIDVALMEKTDRAAVLPIGYAWSDLGAWDAVWAASPHDPDGNAVSGLSVTRESRNCLVRATGDSRIVAVGVQNLVIVSHGADVLVTAMDRSPDLKLALADLPDRPGPAKTAVSAARDIWELGESLTDWLFREALPIWWCFGADRQTGGFFERLGQDLTPPPIPRRALVQARQVYVYAVAGLMGWPGPWAAAVDHGLDFLNTRFQRPDGLFRQSVDAVGEPAQETARLYDQAFVLLALAAAARAAPHRRADLDSRARSLAGSIRLTFGAEGGGFRSDDVSQTFLADPIMHLFEAVLAWSDLEGHTFWRQWTDEIAGHFLDRMVDRQGDRIFEVFDPRWRASTAPDDIRLEPGHHFEWAGLLYRWSQSGGGARAAGVAQALYRSGERGVDPQSGLVRDALRADYSVLKATSRLWPQTERLKAAILLPPALGAADQRRQTIASATRAVEAYLDTPVAGLWRDTPAPSTDAPPALASSFYHVVGAIAAFRDLS